MFENVINFFKNLGKKEDKKQTQSESSKDAAKERLHLVLMQDRANVSADFLELMKQEIIDVIKKYIDVDEGAIDVRLTNKENEDGTNGAPALYANIPIINIKHETKKVEKSVDSAKNEENKKTEKIEKAKKENKKVEEKSNQKEDKDNKKEDVKNKEEKDVVKEENKEQKSNDKDNKKTEDNKSEENNEAEDEIKSEK